MPYCSTLNKVEELALLCHLLNTLINFGNHFASRIPRTDACHAVLRLESDQWTSSLVAREDVNIAGCAGGAGELQLVYTALLAGLRLVLLDILHGSQVAQCALIPCADGLVHICGWPVFCKIKSFWGNTGCGEKLKRMRPLWRDASATWPA